MATVVVFRPGGVQKGNVFTNWADLVDAMSKIEGRKMLEFDDSIQTPCEIPALPPGRPSWDMTDVGWAGYGPRPGRPRPEVHILEGARFTNFRMIGGQVTIVNKATTTSPIADFQNGDHVQIGLRDDAGNAELINEGTEPLFHVEANGAFFFIQNCLFGVSVKSAHPLIRYVLPAGTSSPKPLILNLLGQNQTGNNVVEAGLGAPVLFGALSPAAQVGAEQNGITDAGILRHGPVGRIQRQVLPLPPAAATESLKPDPTKQFFTLPNVILRCDGRPPGFVQYLPKIKGGFTMGATALVPVYTGGQEVIVAEVKGGGCLWVAPADGDTIDGWPPHGGAPPPVPYPDVKIAPHGSRTFVSDGDHNWITISVVP